MPSAQRLHNSLWALIEKSDLREYYNSLTGEATFVGNHATAIVVCDPPDRNQLTD